MYADLNGVVDLGIGGWNFRLMEMGGKQVDNFNEEIRWNSSLQNVEAEHGFWAELNAQWEVH